MTKTSLRRAAVAAAFLPSAALAEVASVPPPRLDPFTPFVLTGEIRYFGGYDDNALLVPDAPPFFSGEQSAPFGGVEIAPTLLVPVSESVALGASGTLGLIRYGGSQKAGTPAFVDDPSDYSSLYADAQFFAEIDVAVAGRGLTLRPGYAYGWEGASEVEAVGHSAHQLRLDAELDMRPGLDLLAHGLANWTDYTVEFPGQPSRDRDGRYAEAGIGAAYTFSQGRRTARAALIRRDNDADGDDWDFTGWRVEGGLLTHVAGPVFADLGVAWETRDFEQGFTDIVPEGRDEEDEWELSASAIWVLEPGRSLDLTVLHERVDANTDTFSYDRTRVTGRFVMRFP